MVLYLLPHAKIENSDGDCSLLVKSHVGEIDPNPVFSLVTGSSSWASRFLLWIRCTAMDSNVGATGWKMMRHRATCLGIITA